jgi:hypothetical protein
VPEFVARRIACVTALQWIFKNLHRLSPDAHFQNEERAQIRQNNVACLERGLSAAKAASDVPCC